jgi:hypothetical protein
VTIRALVGVGQVSAPCRIFGNNLNLINEGNIRKAIITIK